jgi:hypothetical protein
MLHHLAPNGRAGIVLANGSMSSSQNNEDHIRAAMVGADVVTPERYIFWARPHHGEKRSLNRDRWTISKNS